MSIYLEYEQISNVRRFGTWTKSYSEVIQNVNWIQMWTGSECELHQSYLCHNISVGHIQVINIQFTVTEQQETWIT